MTRIVANYVTALRTAGSLGRGRLITIAALIVSPLLVIAFVAFVALVLSHPVYLGDDSAQSYGHVWFLEQSLRAGRVPPLQIPYLEGGDAATFPYALIPWLPTAVARLVLGDWAVTASMGVGVALLLAGVIRWLPRVASPIGLGLVLLNWQLWNGVLQFQLPTIWAFGFACLAAAEFDRASPRRGAALATLALIAHPLMGGAGLLLTLVPVAGQLTALKTRLTGMAIAALVASPAIWMSVHTPSLVTAVSWSIPLMLQIMLQRLSMIGWPWVVHRFCTSSVRLYAPLLILGAPLMLTNVYLSNPRNLKWESKDRFPDYLAAGKIDPQGRYRVLTMSNQEDGMVQLMQAGAVLAQSFSDESIQRHSFGGVHAYRCFLARKGANHVLVQAQWASSGKTNEVELLDTLVREGNARLAFSGSAGTRDYVIESPAPGDCDRRAVDTKS